MWNLYTFFQKVFFVGHIHMSYFGATGTPVLDFWWRLLWVSKPEWVLPYSHCGGKCNVHSLRFTSGATRCRPLDNLYTFEYFICCFVVPSTPSYTTPCQWSSDEPSSACCLVVRAMKKSTIRTTHKSPTLLPPMHMKWSNEQPSLLLLFCSIYWSYLFWGNNLKFFRKKSGQKKSSCWLGSMPVEMILFINTPY